MTTRSPFSVADGKPGMSHQKTAGEKGGGSREKSAAFQTKTGTRSQPTFLR